MPNPALPISSPDITSLSYAILYDISGGLPTITLTNASTVVNPNLLTWWYVITTPSGTPIHTGSATSPDVVHTAWTTLQISSGAWPLLFGVPPCAQVEFSPNSPYVCTLYVKDSANNIYSLTIQQTITRPNGNSQNSCGNFGVAAVGVQVKCYTNPAVVFCTDSTNLAYNNILAPSSTSNDWILVYPPDAVGNQPANGTASNTPYVNFPVGYNGDGYVLYLNEFASYDFGNGATVKVQYKAFNTTTGSAGLTFAVLCNIDLCRLQCQMQAFYEVSKKSCNTVENSVWDQKKTNINYLFTQAILGIIQPLCQIDVPALVAEIQAIIGNNTGNCNCGCTDTGVNFNYPTGSSSSSSGCCPVSTNVIDNNTGVAPTLCPQSYFPVQVKDPTNMTVIGSANNINDLVAIVNATPAWQAYGVAFAEGNCKVGWFPVSPATIPPDIKVNLVGTIIPPSAYVDAIIDINTNMPPLGCPSGSPYPVRVYNPAATLVIGIANSAAEVVSLLNSTPAWASYGIASVQDTCHVQFNLADPALLPPVIKIDLQTTGTSCQSNEAMYLVYMVDPCFPLSPVTTSSFPCNVNVNWGLGVGDEFVGIVTGWANLATALNTFSTKPPQLTISVGATSNSLQIANSDCTAYPHSPVITCNAGSNSYILFGGNHTTELGTTPTLNGVLALGVADSSVVGRIPPPDVTKHMWHTIKIGNFIIVAEGDTGKIYFYDVTNALSPSLARIIQLTPTTVVNNFDGTPHSTNYLSPFVPKPSNFSLYFPTDYYGTMTLNAIWVCEGTTGSIWIIDLYDPGDGVIDSDQNNVLLGKCPRVLKGSTLYFSQDGDLEQAAGLSSGVAIGNSVHVSWPAPTTFGYGQSVIFSQPEYVWAISYDGLGNMYFTGAHGSVARVSSGSTPDITNSHILGSSANFLFRLSSVISGGVLYFAGINLQIGSPPVSYQKLKKVTTASLDANAPVVTEIDGATGVSTTNSYFNVIPLGNCQLVLVYAFGTSPGQGIGIYRLSGGVIVDFVELISQPYYMYNVVAVPNYSQYTPNTFVNP